MNVPTRLGIYGTGLLLAFGAAFGAGSLVEPVLPAADPVPEHAESEQNESEHGEPTPAVSGSRNPEHGSGGTHDSEGER